VIRLWEQPTEIFQQYQGLLPFAALSQTDNPEETLRHVAQQIEQITDKQVQSNVAASTAIISGIALNKEIIQRLLRSEIMKESVIYQEILLEGEAKGLAKGKAEGKAETARQIAINMMRSNISGDLVAQFTGLSLKEVQKLQKLSAKKAQTPKSTKTKRSPKP
jgi:predicted transposase/invertase (TIGR01784 family)